MKWAEAAVGAVDSLEVIESAMRYLEAAGRHGEQLHGNTGAARREQSPKCVNGRRKSDTLEPAPQTERPERGRIQRLEWGAHHTDPPSSARSADRARAAVG